MEAIESKSYSVMVHNQTHSTEDLILNKDLFCEIFNEGDYICIYDYNDVRNSISRSNNSLILQIKSNTFQILNTGRFEISLSKGAAEPLQLKPMSMRRFCLEKILPSQGTIDFVELSFKKQFLSRGNMWRFKNAILERPIYVGQNVVIGRIQAQIQEIGLRGKPKLSGIIAKDTNCIFRSRSTRIIWLVQLSGEMWEHDENGDMYFDKFLTKFVSPLLDRWKLLGVSHSLTIIFYARTFRIKSLSNQDKSNESYKLTVDKCLHEDHYKVVIENAADVDKVSYLKILKSEFWAFAHDIGWRIDVSTDPNNSVNNSTNSNNNNRINNDIYLPSGAYDGNFLEAINTTLNLLDKHYMDRDLQRTGNSIVMISAGVGVFKVKPNISQITKQRMMDAGIGIDFISLSQPPLHAVPLFHVDCSDEKVVDFYEFPHWINISYIDCDRDSSVTVESSADDEIKETKPQLSIKSHTRNYSWTGLTDFQVKSLKSLRSGKLLSDNETIDERWGREFKPLPFASIISGYVYPRAKEFLSNLPCPLLSLLRNIHQSEYITLNKKVNLLEWGYLPFPSSFHTLNFDNLKSSYHQSYDEVNEYMNRLPKYRTRYVEFASDVNLTHKDTKGNKNESAISILNDEYGTLDTVRSVAMSSSFASSEGGLSAKSFLSNRFGSYFGIDDNNNGIGTGTGGSGNNDNSNDSESYIRSDLEKVNFCVESDFDDIIIFQGLTSSLSKQILDDHDNLKFYTSKSHHYNQHHHHQSRNQQHASSQHSSNNSVIKVHDSERMKDLPHSLDLSKYTVSSSSSSSSGVTTIATTSTTGAGAGAGAGGSTAIMKSPKAGQEKRMNQDTKYDGDIDVSHKLDSDNQTSKSPLQDRMPSTNPNLSNSNPTPVLSKQQKTLSFGSPSFIRPEDIPQNEDSRYDFENKEGQIFTKNKNLTREYRRRSQSNPFRREEGINYINARTHNRRRWSHVFPTGKLGKSLTAYYGLNWKSLTQPAVLPITTDYMPTIKELYNNYDVQSNYRLIIDKTECPFDSIENLLMEMVCQRLSMEFQFVEIDDPTVYINFANVNLNAAMQSSHSMSRFPTKKIDTSNFYILSMGHRIQFLTLDSESREIGVTLLLSKIGVNDSERTATYNYKIWVSQTQQYSGMSQTFSQFPSEFLWNKADSTLMGSLDFDFNPETNKAKRIRFNIVPKLMYVPNDEDEYFASIEKLIQFLSKYTSSSTSSLSSSSSEILKIGYDSIKNMDETKNQLELVTRKYTDSVKLWFSGPGNDQPKWVYFRYDKRASMMKLFHFELHWFACDAWLIEDFVNHLFRRCLTFGLRIVQIPEFFCTSNLRIHPYRPQPYIHLISNENLRNINSLYTSTVILFENLFVKIDTETWIRDDSQITDWKTLGSPIFSQSNDISGKSQLSEMLSELGMKPSSPMSTSSQKDQMKKNLPEIKLSAVRRNTNNNNNPNRQDTNIMKSYYGKIGIGIASAVKNPPDRQYMHRQGFAALRIGTEGFVWLLNTSARVNDINISLDEKKLNVLRALDQLSTKCTTMCLCLEIIVDMIEDSMKLYNSSR